MNMGELLETQMATFHKNLQQLHAAVVMAEENIKNNKAISARISHQTDSVGYNFPVRPGDDWDGGAYNGFILSDGSYVDVWGIGHSQYRRIYEKANGVASEHLIKVHAQAMTVIHYLGLSIF